MSLTVPTAAYVTMTAKGDMRHLCPFVDEVDHGHITIVWSTASGETLELHALRKYLNCYKNSRFWETADLEVTCSTWPTHAEARP